jgi:hypothetical protein
MARGGARAARGGLPGPRRRTCCSTVSAATWPLRSPRPLARVNDDVSICCAPATSDASTLRAGAGQAGQRGGRVRLVGGAREAAALGPVRAAQSGAPAAPPHPQRRHDVEQLREQLVVVQPVVRRLERLAQRHLRRQSGATGGAVGSALALGGGWGGAPAACWHSPRPSAAAHARPPWPPPPALPAPARRPASPCAAARPRPAPARAQGSPCRGRRRRGTGRPARRCPRRLWGKGGVKGKERGVRPAA